MRSAMACKPNSKQKSDERWPKNSVDSNSLCVSFFCLPARSFKTGRQK
jgi:hypothetical protein